MQPEPKAGYMFPLSHYTVSYEPCPALLRGYNSRQLTAEEITETCELLLDTARRYACRYWLLDGRSHHQAQPEALHRWMQDEYFPRIRRELGRETYLAFLVPQQVWAGLPALGYAEVEDSLVHGVRMGWFTDEAAALDWLAERRGAGPPKAARGPLIQS